MAMHHDEAELKAMIMEPKEDERFYPSKIIKIVKELFEDRLKGIEYDPNNANALCERLVAELKEKVKRGIQANFKSENQISNYQKKVESLDTKLEYKLQWEKLKDKVQELLQNACGMFKMITMVATHIQAQNINEIS